MLPATLRASRTMRNFPKPPVGRRIASRSPPTLPSAYPVLQETTLGAATTAAAPRHCRIIYTTGELIMQSSGKDEKAYYRNVETEIRIQEHFPAAENMSIVVHLSLSTETSYLGTEES